MAVTNYHTINGQILSEQTGGVRTEYVQDALGSVIATTDANRDVLNTYRYAPYGTQIASTGSSQSPGFLWLGIHDYRATGLPQAGYYFRAQTYGSEQCSWNSVSPNWPGNTYGYRKQRPTNPLVAPSSATQLTRKCKNPQPTTPCLAGYDIEWEFSWTGDTFTGWMVQKLDVYGSASCCDPPNLFSPFTCPVNPQQIHGITVGFGTVYYEAFWVEDSSMQCHNPDCTSWSGSCTDHWQFQYPNTVCMHGFWNTQGSIALIPAKSNATPPGGLTCAGYAPCSYSPSGKSFSGTPPAFDQAPASVSWSFDCCGLPKNGPTNLGCANCPAWPSSSPSCSKQEVDVSPPCPSS